ncbi:molybdopterin-dependent oxidoreductase [Protofrankia symbiont of Coriaria ruscifolia]|uniref:molybdopterin-dependent oxidoreductase n=1 Tax=Protofrankia symbiont of Coriaria ruscifolia TaxID=1306542 RepID=UPI001041199C|nr:molybdopterin-dependent oxidoreductase [Protofrankia symbiont of Coriaria ruscifolia]
MTATHCPYCSLQCGIVLHPGSRGIGVTPQEDFPTNRGGLCSKGWTAADLLDHPERLTGPLVRDHRGGELRPASWDEALDRIVTAIGDSQRRYGPDSVGCFGGGGLTNEKAYTLGKFARVALRSRSIDYNGRFCMSSAAMASNRAFGIDRGLPFPVSDIAKAQVVLLVGGNPADTMPPVMQWFDAGRAAGACHIVVDPRATASARGAALHLQNTPGTDLALANGMMHIAIRDRLVDNDYVDARTVGFDAVRRAVTAYWPARVERITGVPEQDLRRAVHLLAEAETAMVLTARGAEQHATGTDTAQAFINLALALGLPGRPFSGYGTVTGQGNGQGGREHGQKADQLPGYRKLADPADRAHVAAVWGIDPDELPPPGVSAFEMLDALGTDGGVRALLVFGSNPVVSGPDANRIARRLGALDFLAVSDIFVSETAQFADVVLPCTQWAEEEGTMTNLEGRVLLRRAAVQPPPGVRTDLQMLADLAWRLGRGRFFTDSAREVFDELRRASAGGLADYAGITYERIAAEHGVFWPCPDEAHPGTPRLFTETFATPDGRARFHPVRHRGAVEQPDRQYPYYLTTGRIMQQYQSGTQTRRVRALLTAASDPSVEIHPTLAARYGIAGGDLVEIRSRRGRAVFRARLTDTIRPDTLFTPFHWSGMSTANLLTNPALDPHSRMPEFKVCAVTIARLDALPEGGDTIPTGATVPVATDNPIGTDYPVAATAARPVAGSTPSTDRPTAKDRRMHGTPLRRLVVVGNGMAGARTVEEILARGGAEMFTITVFGDEPHGSYNRILLSNVLAGLEEDAEIFLNPPEWYRAHGVRLRAGVRVNRIDRHARTVFADDGTAEPYDKLVVATGSRPFIPPIDGVHRPDGTLRSGVFAFRTLDDCRRMIAFANGIAKGHGRIFSSVAGGVSADIAEGARCRTAVVIGGGLLGLEAARGLQEHGLDVRVLHAAPTLMNAQLDDEAGEILRRSVEGLGITVRTSARTVALLGEDVVSGVALADGTTIDTDMVVITAGIRPNVDLGLHGGLTVEQGIVTDDQMRSVDDPDIYVVGECAQHRGEVYGLVAPLWEQAAVLADHITGAKPDAAYHGSKTVTTLKVAGVDVAAMGLRAPEHDDDEVVRFVEPRRGVYKNVVIRDGKLVGATLVGDTARAAFLLQAFDREFPLPEERLKMLFDIGAPTAAVGAAELTDDAQVCNCNGVSKGTLVACVRSGQQTAAGVMAATRAGKGCGSCRTLVTQIVEWATSEDFPDELDELDGPDGRIRADIRADGVSSVMPRIAEGVTPAQLRRIADVADRYGSPMVKITGGRRIDLLEVREEDLPAVWADLGMPSWED